MVWGRPQVDCRTPTPYISVAYIPDVLTWWLTMVVGDLFKISGRMSSCPHATQYVPGPSFRQLLYIFLHRFRLPFSLSVKERPC